MSHSEAAKTMTVLALASLVIFLIAEAGWLLFVCLFFLVCAVFNNPAGTLIAKGWMKFAHALGNFNAKLLLGLTFWLVLTPVALITRAFNKDIKNRFVSRESESMFEDAEKIDAPSYFEKPW